MSQDTRRASYQKNLDIEVMIAEENDPKQRTFLIILNSINNSLIANTNTTLELSSKFAAHLTKFEQKVEDDAALLNKGQGAWRVVAWILGVAQVAVVGAWFQFNTDLRQLQLSFARIEARIVQIDRK